MASPQDYELEELKAQIAALTARIYRVEQKTGLTAVPAQPQAVPPPPPRPVAAPASVPPGIPGAAPQWRPSTLAAPADRPDLESKIGQVWLNRIGIVAMLIGATYFLKLAFDNGWIGPHLQVAIGILAGIGLVVWSERFRSQGHAPFSYSLKAVGIGFLYASFWAAFKFYAHPLIDAPVAFGAMTLVTAATIVMAVFQDAELLATYALIGGFSTPLLLSTGENHEIALFSYVCLLDLAILVLSRFKPWKRQLWLSFAGTLIMYWGWYSKFYIDGPRDVTVGFAALFGAVFAAIPLVTPFERSSRGTGPSITLTLLPLFNAGNLFLALYAMYSSETVTLTWYALGLGAAYLAIGAAFKRQFSGKDAQVIYLLHIAITIAFITIAIPLKLQHHNSHWITIGWLIESAVLLWIAVKTETNFLRYLAGSTLALGIFRLLVMDRYTTSLLLFNPRFATYLVAIAIMGAILYFGNRYGSEREQPFVKLAGIGFNLLALIALTLEASGFFSRRQAALHNTATYGAEWNNLSMVENFSYSAIWLLYGAGVMVFGFWKQSSFVRWQALVLMALTIGKVFIYDTWGISQGYRVLSFMALGAVLLAISFAYQRDWLKLSSSSAGE
jgi:uncharacterized membrane protein